MFQKILQGGSSNGKSYTGYGNAVEITDTTYTIPTNGILFAKCGSGSNNLIYFNVDNVFPTDYTFAGTTNSTATSVPVFANQKVNITGRKGTGKLYFIPFV